jgi:8-oxo-dGTP pyrophosphatase MutT (NUDIX family)
LDNLVSTAHNKEEYAMPRTFCDLNSPTLAELLSDPIVQMAMSADHVTEQQLMSLISGTLSKLAAGSQSGSAGNPKPSPGFANYRPGVGIMLLNANNDVFVGRRTKTKGKAWQMPQGGIDEGEEPCAAAFRELREEIGTCNAEILAESGSWLSYDLPAELVATARHGPWRGQRQKWFVMRFKGSDADINIMTGEPEFSAWKWVSIEQLTDLIVPFKRHVYLSVLNEFCTPAGPL